MKAVISILGKQFLVQENDEILIEKLNLKEKTINFDNVLLIIDDKKIIIGSPKIEKAEVQVEKLEDTKGKKIKVIKFKAKKRYKKISNQRRHLTKIRINKIKV